MNNWLNYITLFDFGCSRSVDLLADLLAVSRTNRVATLCSSDNTTTSLKHIRTHISTFRQTSSYCWSDNAHFEQFFCVLKFQIFCVSLCPLLSSVLLFLFKKISQTIWLTWNFGWWKATSFWFFSKIYFKEKTRESGLRSSRYLVQILWSRCR